MGDWEVLPPLPNCSHGIILVRYTFQFQQNLLNHSRPHTLLRVWTRADYHSIKRCISDIDWSEEFFTIGVQEQYSRLLNVFEALSERYVPTRSPKNSQDVPWNTSCPRALIRDKTEAWENYKRVRTVAGRSHPLTLEAWNSFASCNKEIKIFSINSQVSYERSLAAQIHSKPKLLHSYLNHRKVGKPRVGPVRLETGVITDDPVLMAESFAASFASVFSTEVPTNPAPHQTCTSFMQDLLITPDMVTSVLSQLDENSSMGPDNVHPRFLSRVASELGVPLSIIFNECLREGSLPTECHHQGFH